MNKIKFLTLILFLILPSFVLAQSELDFSPTVEAEIRYEDGKPTVLLNWSIDQEIVNGFIVRKLISGEKVKIDDFLPSEEGKWGESGFLKDSDVEIGKTYTYFVSAYDTSGAESNEGSATITVRSQGSDEGTSESDNEIKIIVSRPCEQNASQENNLTAVGGASIMLIKINSDLYFDGFQERADTIATKKVDSIIEKAYFGAYSLTKIAHKSYDAIIPDNGASSSLIFKGLEGGNYLLKINKNGFSETKLIFKLKDNQSGTIDSLSTILIPDSKAEPPNTGKKQIDVIFASDGIYRSILGATNLLYSSVTALRGWIVDSAANTD